MAQSGRIVADLLVLLRQTIQPGQKTQSLNAIAEEYLQKHNALSSYLDVQFDGVVCISINNEVVHGIPSDRVLKDGDIVGLDIAACCAGYHADAAITVPVGAVSLEAQKLMQATEQALALGISLATPGRRLYDISAVIQDFVEDRGFSVVSSLVGHGIGRTMWEPPEVPNYRIAEMKGLILRSGMTFTIEPMVTAGNPDIETLADKWTVVSCDGSLSAHFEHTIAVTENGPRILTLPSSPHEAWATNIQRPGTLGSLADVLRTLPTVVKA